MRTQKLFLAIPAVLFCSIDMAAAQTSPQPPAQAPGVVTGGSNDVLVNGKPAARVGDNTSNGGPVVEGSTNVFINGKPAAVVGGRTGCNGVVVGGSSNVFVNGKPLATAGSQTSDCKGR
jgi:uncharacterized Zn-binding protein involved in type VI secretion